MEFYILNEDKTVTDGEEPLLFETMIFDNSKEEYQKRYHTYEEAVAGHKKVCDILKSKQLKKDGYIEIQSNKY